MHRQLIALIILSTNVVLSTIAALSSNAMADSTWQPFGPGGGGWIEDVVAHPTHRHEVWAMTDLSGLFRSQDAGVTWRKMSAGVERGVMARKQIVSFRGNDLIPS